MPYPASSERSVGDSAGTPIRAAMLWPEGSDQVSPRIRLRWTSEAGPRPPGSVPTGKLNSGVEILVSMRLLGRTAPSPKSKNVCPPELRGSKMNAKNWLPPSPARLAR
jgi:hypothetical protein